jgi:hypothetical protein
MMINRSHPTFLIDFYSEGWAACVPSELWRDSLRLLPL